MWIKQRGSELGYKIIVTIYRILGYKVTKTVVWLVAFFYACITPTEREAMKTYYKYVGRPYTFLFYVSHIYQFSLSIFDRFVTRINPELFEIERVNLDTFIYKDKNRILALAHVGNWANTFVAFKYENRTIHITADDKLKASIVEYEASLNEKNSLSINIISLKDGLKASVEMAKALQNGDDLAIMVDRLVDPLRFVEVKFLNVKTKFNKNPFEIAYNRNINMIGVTVIRSGDMQYKVIFSDVIEVDKSRKKEEAIGIMSEKYAQYLESILREYPKQWFNFYQFWESE
jgi:predicted LPLAT superfamily acyltransferase